MEWVWFTLFAASMQAVRTAGQKHLTSSLSAITATWARYGFGFPVAVIYFFIILKSEPTELPDLSNEFYLFVAMAALSQLGATLLLVKVLSLGNFAVGTTYAKTEALLAAVFGTVLFGVPLTGLSWLAIIVGVAGIFFVSVKKAKLNIVRLISGTTPILGIAAGAVFAITSLWLRAASLESSANPILTAAYILMLSIGIQGVLCSFLVHWQNTDNWRQLLQQPKTIIFVGLTGTLGSIGWYTAFSFQEAAIVKALGQVEFVFTLLLTYFFFKESIKKLEWLGIACVLVSVFILLGINDM